MPSKTAIAGIVTACASVVSLLLFRRAGARRLQPGTSHPPAPLTPQDLAAKDARRAFSDDPFGDDPVGDDPFGDESVDDDPAGDPDAPTRETPMGLDPTTMALESESEHYDAVSVDELGAEWLRRAVQSDRPGKP